ncbi:hypothetical protein [Metallosphaera hakonensis]|uniref:DUF2249 domain-containing protein n=1 Tax=Metallosphaera hakonensis JCM 8857 = DSM 7519 TaxID=1293036 RepID=A0A2U9IRZ2_9CREN|nr:hypothetical protein [Metallosphaera hakonensis]AWR98802.1 hypothetical protein DFR87_02855 [Metallosphaera hakonensis JCM 8857 = DSM 7519]
MDSIIDLDDFNCSSDPLEALEYLSGKGVLFTISKDSPFFPIIRSKFKIREIRREGDTVYFTISSDGSTSTS